MRVCLLGDLSVTAADVVLRRTDFPSRQTRLVVAYLALNRGRVATREELAELLWPDALPAAWRTDVSAVISKIRAVVRGAGLDDHGLLPGRSGTVRLELGPCGGVDVDAACEAVAAARDLLAADRAAMALRAADEAIALLGAGFLPSERGPWVDARREELDLLLADALSTSAAAALQLRDAATAKRRATTLCALEPYAERGVRLLMHAHVLDGERSLAVAAYEQCRRRLRDDLGVSPSPETEAAYLDALTAGDAAAPELPLPARLRAGSDVPRFVGRRTELQHLRSTLRSASTGPHLVVVRGEAGVGKSRLVAEVAGAVHGTSTTVLSGRCDEEIRLPFAPLVEALDPLVRTCAAERLDSIVGGAAAELARVMPSIRSRLPAVPAPTRAPPAVEQLRLLEAVRLVLERLSQQRPLTLVLDDLHWADSSTLRLVRHLMRTPTRLAVTVVATIRDGEPTSGALDGLLADAAADGRSTSIPLSGLTPAEAAQLLGDPTRAEAAHRLTAGNPLFLCELARSSRDWTASPELPANVVDAVGRRARRLSPDAQQLLAAAAISGWCSDLATVADAIAFGLARATAAADEAAGHGLLRAGVVHDGAGIEFVHPLVRRALVESMTPARRALLHHLVGSAIERRHGIDGAHAAELHLHFANSSAPGDRHRAVEAARRAAAHAAERLGYEEAVAHAADAVELLQELGAADAELAVPLVEHAEALLRAGDPHAAETFRRAVDVARAANVPSVLARCALGLSDVWSLSGTIADDRVALLEEAAGGLGAGDVALEARVTARLACELYYVEGTRDRRDRLSDRAVRLARGVDDPEALAAALHARNYATWGLGGAERRRACADEILALSERARAAELTLAGLAWSITASLELGDVRSAQVAVARYQQLADERRQPRHVWYGLTRAAMLDVLAGDGDRALETITRARALGAGEADEENVHRALLAPITIARGTVSDLPALISHVDGVARLVGDANPSTRYVTAVAAAAAAEWGATSDARRLLARLPSGWLDSDDLVSAGTLAAAAWAVGRLRDRPAADAIRSRVEPLRGTHLVAAGGVVYWGAASHWVGELSSVLGERRRAVESLREAIADHRRVGSRPFERRSRRALVECVQEDAPRIRRTAVRSGP